MKQEQFVKEFRIGDLFEATYGKFIRDNKKNAYNTPYITTTAMNNGIGSSVKGKPMYPGNTITIATDGSIGSVFYQEQPYSASNIVASLVPKTISRFNVNIALYIISIIKKYALNYSYDKKYSIERVRNTIIPLPIKPKIDFAMIREIILRGGVEMLEHIDTSSWMEFKLEDLFNASNGTVDIKSSDINNEGEFVITSGIQNNGILGKSSIVAPIFKGNSITVDMFGNVFYRDFDYKMVTHARVFSLSSQFLTKENGLFFATCIQKLTQNFSYNLMCNWNRIKDLTIKLPVLPATDENYSVGDIDYELMESIIRELEEERIRELEVYLQVTGLNDTTLTPEEEQALRLGPGG